MRPASLLIASVTSIIGLVFPFLLGHQVTGFNQSVLAVMMAGIAGAFIYGAGFKPRLSLLDWLISPAVTWPLMIGPFALLVSLR
jgi:predicted membrane protein